MNLHVRYNHEDAYKMHNPASRLSEQVHELAAKQDR